MLKPNLSLTCLATLALISSAEAGGFSLYTEGSAAAIGNFAAGIAAEGADAAVGWYNPAGLVLLKKQQMLLGGVGVLPSTSLTGTTSYTTLNPFGGLSFPYGDTFRHLQGGQAAAVPSCHYARPLGPKATFGFSVLSPFGLSTDYPLNSPVRYAATLSQLETLNVSPELGGVLTDYLSIGAGLDLQYARVVFNRVIGSPALMGIFDLPPDTLDSEIYNSGDSFGLGFHAGALLRFHEDHTRLGVNYQSGVRHQFNGKSRLTGRLADTTLNIFDPVAANPSATAFSNSLYSNDITLPSSVTLSAYQDLNTEWALLGSVVYVGWHTFRSITLNNVLVGAPLPDGSGTQLTTANSTTNENYRDTWRIALGANYHVTPQWMMRVGGGYDKTPTVNADRDVRLPDSSRVALSIGSHYQWRPSLGFDVGYTYLFGIQEATVNTAQPIGTRSLSQVNATASNHAQLVGLQAVWTMD